MEKECGLGCGMGEKERWQDEVGRGGGGGGVGGGVVVGRIVTEITRYS